MVAHDTILLTSILKTVPAPAALALHHGQSPSSIAKEGSIISMSWRRLAAKRNSSYTEWPCALSDLPALSPPLCFASSLTTVSIKPCTALHGHLGINYCQRVTEE